MDANGVCACTARQVLQLLNQLFGVENPAKCCEFTKSNLLQQSESSFAKSTTLNFAEAESTEVKIVLRFGISRQQLVNELRVKRFDEACTNLAEHLFLHLLRLRFPPASFGKFFESLFYALPIWQRFDQRLSARRDLLLATASRRQIAV